MDFQLHAATEHDIPLLADHHGRMFAEITASEGRSLGAEKILALKQAYREKLERQLSTATCQAWFIEDKGRVVASGAVSIMETIPHPDDLSCTIAYIHSVYTEQMYRGKGAATLLIRKAVEHCRTLGIKRVTLNASAVGRKLYEKLGFAEANNPMILWLDKTC